MGSTIRDGERWNASVGRWEAVSAAPALVFNEGRTSPENPKRGTGGGNGRVWEGIDWAGGSGGGVCPEDIIERYTSPMPAVTPDSALMVSAVWACIDAVSAPQASSDWNVYEGVRGAGDQKALPADPMQWTLNTQFNPEMTAQSGKRAMMIAAAGWGNGYAEIVRDRAGRVVELWPLRPDRCELRRDQDTGELYLQVYNDWQGGTVDLPMRDVFHIRGPGISGVLGDSMFARAVQSIAMAVAMEQFAGAYFANGTQMGIVMEYPGVNKMDDAAFKRTKNQFTEKHAGSRNAFKFALAEGGVKLHQLGVEAEKAQMTDARYQQIEEICRWWKVPPHKIGHLLRSTNNNIEHQGLEFTRDTLRPWKVEIQQESDRKLFGWRTKKFVEIDLDWAAEGDFQSRATAIQILRGCGVYSVNDALRKLGENTISKADGGDLRTMNGASVQLQDVGKNMAPAAPAPKPAAANDDTADDEDDVMAAWLRSAYGRAQARYTRRMGAGGDRRNAAELALADAAEYMTAEFDEMGAPMAAGTPLRQLAADLVQEVVSGLAPADAVQRLIQAKRETP